ncbi:MAG: hypothetical protein COT81_04450 [Candidatus Buchananbacteria bacterium CG10_big_fil_rev_8_21_14_0_10_42_9]|uniref:N-formylglutamate amidohydrolase n=1 Tax=Candidatus Buchananbacteria bacterium CG10_big_fil_rev_8_21_14_0_10_42_9 TaxID=1974526 RepID=A0A2H0W0N1_9BACT|nr:MAG: hypothetical protein COT81_04450 [Candidatus Buchananbacteria bacterium CG10_big_fil_rev_8_21_14_0_10_42_9]
MRSRNNKSLKKIIKLFEQVSPIIVSPTRSSLTVSLSNRFFLFRLMQMILNRIEDNPYLNFISVLKHYKVLGRFLHGTIRELHHDRNKSYFKHFFLSDELYRLVKAELDWIYERNKTVRLTISKWGIIICDNYKKNQFNALLFTTHSGSWVPDHIAKKQTLSAADRYLEEDVDVDKIYADIVLQGAGIWIDSKLSRFACDYNRAPEKAIYGDKSEEWVDKLWQKPLAKTQREWLMEGYHEFYFTLEQLVDTYRFNIILDGHSMKDVNNRPDICLLAELAPPFYMPIVQTMKEKLVAGGFKRVSFDSPFPHGYILWWLHTHFPDVFICMIEINKKHYMNKTRTKSLSGKISSLSKVLRKLFHLEEEL